MNEKSIVFAGDHNGLGLKSHLIKYLQDKGYDCIDLGPKESDGKVDYPDYAGRAAQIIHNGGALMGILICGTGQGCSIVANKFPKVRAALIHNLESAPLSREHNDSNMLCLGSWLTPPQRAEMIVDSFLETKFGEGRHIPRVEKIEKVYSSTGEIGGREKIVFTNGVFDVLHKGHVELLRFAKELGGKLVVGINSDRAVKELKGPDRPINNEIDRKRMLESIGDVDEVIIFDDVDSIGVINQIMPDIVVKGGEWGADEVRMRDRIPQNIDVKIFPMVKDYSTSSTLKKIKEGDTWEKKEETLF